MSRFHDNIGVLTQPSIWNGLTSYWRLNESSGTSIADSKGSITGTLNTGSINNAGKYGTCYRNTVANSNGITFGNNYAFERTSPWTFNLWVKFDTLAANQILINKVGADKGYFFFQQSSNKFLVQLYATTNVYIEKVENTASMTSTGVWYMVTVTYDGSSTAAGLFIYTQSISRTLTTNKDTLNQTMVGTENLRLGAFTGTQFGTLGYIDEVGVWNRPLTQSEITSLYNQGAGIYY